jgi:deoxyribodipyrimidine photo-lyase
MRAPSPRGDTAGMARGGEGLQLVWFRRDLRLDDNPAVRAAADGDGRVACCFVLDPRLYQGPGVAPARVRFLLEGLQDLDERLQERGGGLLLAHGHPESEVPRLATELGAVAVQACADDEPFAMERDAAVERHLGAAGVPLTLHHDQTLVPHEAVATQDGTPCRTYAAYVRAVGRVLAGAPTGPERMVMGGRLRRVLEPADVPSSARLGVHGTGGDLRGGESAGLERLRDWRDDGLSRYARHRNDVADPRATSRLSPYLKLGMLSPRRVMAVAERGNASVWRAQLLWRDWFKYVLHHHPNLADEPVDPRFRAVRWPGSDAHFEAWARGETGYGLVDAGMRQLAEMGFQPNRIRLVCASFLVKDLHVDWRRGERWYREHLIDGDLSQNAGNWQWVAGLGLDAAPYFRIFNPERQEQRFDPDGVYVNRWAPDRPAPIVDHELERRRALDLYGAGR